MKTPKIDPSKPVELRIPKKKKLLDCEKVSIRKAVLRAVRIELERTEDFGLAELYEDWLNFAKFKASDAADPNDPNFVEASRLARKTFKHLMGSLRRELRYQADNLMYFP